MNISQAMREKGSDHAASQATIKNGGPYGDENPALVFQLYVVRTTTTHQSPLCGLQVPSTPALVFSVLPTQIMQC